MLTSNVIRKLTERTYGDGEFQEIILNILADIMERLERLDQIQTL